jgi:hypothetical protein
MYNAVACGEGIDSCSQHISKLRVLLIRFWIVVSFSAISSCSVIQKLPGYRFKIYVKHEMRE